MIAFSVTQECPSRISTMVNDVFGDQIEHNVGVYMDDIIFKSKKINELPIDMREIFEKIRRVRM